MGRPALDRRVVRALQRLARDGVPAAEARRLVAGACGDAGLPQPSYSTVLRIVLRERERLRLRSRGPASPVDSLAKGRFPTPYELEDLASRRRPVGGS